MLDKTFFALADPTRRAIGARLAKGDAIAVGEIARGFPMSLPAVIKHLGVLTNGAMVFGKTAHATIADYWLNADRQAPTPELRTERHAPPSCPIWELPPRRRRCYEPTNVSAAHRPDGH